MVAVPMLSVLGAAIGASRVVEVKPGFTQYAILWTGTLAESGAGKSPALGAAVGPYYRLEELHHNLHTEDCERIRQAHENLPGDGQSEPEFPAPGSSSGTRLSKHSPVLQQNPQGLLLSADELSGWLGSFNQYKGKGADRSHWLSLYDGARLTIDRKTGPVKLIIVPNGIVSITGGIQPGVLRRALSDDDFDSGLPARFVFTMPPDRPLGWSDVPRPPDDDYAAILKRISDARGNGHGPAVGPARELFAGFKNEDTTRLRDVPGHCGRHGRSQPAGRLGSRWSCTNRMGPGSSASRPTRCLGRSGCPAGSIGKPNGFTPPRDQPFCRCRPARIHSDPDRCHGSGPAAVETVPLSVR
ncbi:MAG: DUF3987 domain-containing protein [Planctomycetaceae bacterium]